MEEQVRANLNRATDGPSGLDDPFASGAEEFGGMAVINGHDAPVSGMTLGEIRTRLADRFEIEPNSTVQINGEVIQDESRVVRTGERVEFVRYVGEKGASVSFPLTSKSALLTTWVTG